MNSQDSSPIARLRHHVSGAIARGEAQPITEIPATPAPSAHTPGPWAVHGLAGLYCKDIAICESAHGYPVALAVSRRSYTPYGAANRSIQETEANARLIASAPDLLNLLTAADRLEELTGENLAVYARTYAALARAAIAKAKGVAL